MSNDIILKFENVYKSFAGVHALKGVNFSVRRGKVNILAGENGAGKSTLMKILTGAHKLDSGRILYEGEEFKVKNPREALDKKIAMIYQEFNLVPELTVEENIFLGRELTKGVFLDGKTIRERTQKVLQEYAIDLKPDELVGNLSVAKKQMLEIAKALASDAKVIIMDEPTSSLTVDEVEHLYTITRDLLNRGISIVFISHKMEEVYKIGEYVTVLRDGETVGEWMLKDITSDELITAIAARKIDKLYPKKEVNIGETILKVDSLTKAGMYQNISFSLRKGEIVGMAGLVGAGRTEIALTLFGYYHQDSGAVEYKGKKVKYKLPTDAIQDGIAYLPEDRKLLGVNLEASIKQNIAITNMDILSGNFFVSERREKNLCNEAMKKLSIKAPSIEQTVGNLSGGNQQKVALVKWIMRDIDVLILDEPTRGVDVGAKEEIYKIIGMLAEKGIGIILISSDLPEVTGLSDKIVVMHEGALKGIVDVKQDLPTQESLMKLMIG